MQRPETAAENMRLIMAEVFKPIFEMAAKEKEAQNLAKPSALVTLPQDRPARRALTIRSKQ